MLRTTIVIKRNVYITLQIKVIDTKVIGIEPKKKNLR